MCWLSLWMFFGICISILHGPNWSLHDEWLSVMWIAQIFPPMSEETHHQFLNYNKIVSLLDLFMATGQNSIVCCCPNTHICVNHSPINIHVGWLTNTGVTVTSPWWKTKFKTNVHFYFTAMAFLANLQLVTVGSVLALTPLLASQTLCNTALCCSNWIQIVCLFAQIGTKWATNSLAWQQE